MSKDTVVYCHSRHHCGLMLASARHQRIPLDKFNPICHSTYEHKYIHFHSAIYTDPGNILLEFFTWICCDVFRSKLWDDCRLKCNRFMVMVDWITHEIKREKRLTITFWEIEPVTSRVAGKHLNYYTKSAWVKATASPKLHSVNAEFFK